MQHPLGGLKGVGDEKKKYIPSSIRQKAAYKNGTRRLIFSMRPSKAYEEEKALNGKTDLFPFTTGSSYIGSWKDNKKHGFGTLTFVNGSKYEGEFENHKRHGKGTFWIKEKSNHRKLYAGDWKCDKPDGFGVYYAQDGDKYEGGWKEGKRHGKGMMVYTNGDVYEGDWAADGRCGLGLLRLKNGDRYEGSWMQDAKEGPGLFYFASTGKVYEGEWANGVANCGQLRDQNPKEAAIAAALLHSESKAVVTEAFTLPELELLDPDGVLTDTVTRIRQERIRRQQTAGHVAGDVSNASSTGEEEQVDASSDEGGGERLFSEEELGHLAEAFYAYANECSYHEQQEGEGTRGGGAMTKPNRKIVCGDVLTLFTSLGVPVDPAWLSEFFVSIQANEDTPLTFADFIDMTAITLQSGLLPVAEGEGSDDAIPEEEEGRSLEEADEA